MDETNHESEEITGNGALPVNQPRVISSKPKPTKALPTNRITFEKQIDVLRAYPALSGPEHKPVRLKEVSDLIKMNEGTISLLNPLFLDVGFLQRNDGGFVPSEETFQYLQAYNWRSPTALHKLAPLLSRSWFAEALTPRLTYRPLDEDEAVLILGEVAAASPEYKSQLRLLLDYLEATGIVTRDEGKIKLASPSSVPATVALESHQTRVEREQEPRDTHTVQQVVIQPAENLIQLHVALSIDMKEIAKWSPERIGAFFDGIAAVMKAKAGLEEVDKSGK